MECLQCTPAVQISQIGRATGQHLFALPVKWNSKYEEEQRPKQGGATKLKLHIDGGEVIIVHVCDTDVQLFATVFCVRNLDELSVSSVHAHTQQSQDSDYSLFIASAIFIARSSWKTYFRIIISLMITPPLSLHPRLPTLHPLLVIKITPRRTENTVMRTHFIWLSHQIPRNVSSHWHFKITLWDYGGSGCVSKEVL